MFGEFFFYINHNIIKGGHMNSLKAFLTIFTLIFAITIATSQSEKTLVKSFNFVSIRFELLNISVYKTDWII